jgi:hypothetical protein
MTAPAHLDLTGPEPPAELLGLVRRDSPAMREVNKSIARFGYAHTKPGAISNAEIEAAGLLVVRGLCVDSLFLDNPQGRAAWKALQR